MAPATKERIDRGTGTGLGAPWNVIVLNDHHNTFQGVASALASTLPEVSYDQGLRFADRIHSNGRAIVWSGHLTVFRDRIATEWRRARGDAARMVEIAPRYDPRILEAVRALDDRAESIAEISRRVGVAAAQLGLPKPSYVHLRRRIVAHREEEDAERARRDEIREILYDAYYDFMRSRVVDAYDIADRIREAGR